MYKKESLEEILNTYKWIKVASYKEADARNSNIDWKYEYSDLVKHHKNETEFLIEKCRELAKYILNQQSISYIKLISILKDRYETIIQFINDIEFNRDLKPLLGSCEEIVISGGPDMGSKWVRVYHFKDLDIYLQIEGYYCSYGGISLEDKSWSSTSIKEVKPKSVVKTIYQ
jgi:hypothetical protein